MNPEVRTINTSGLFRYGRLKLGDQTPYLFLEGIDISKYMICNKHDQENFEPLEIRHLEEEIDYFISNQLSLLIFGNAGRHLPGEEPIFEAGRYAVKQFPQIKKRVAAIKLISPKTLFNKGAKENPKYNRTKDIFIRDQKNSATATVVYKDGITTLEDGTFLIKEICDWNRGIYYGYIELTEAKNISVKEIQCITKGADKCIFKGHWKSPPIGRRIKNYFFFKTGKEFIDDYEKAIEERDQTVFTLEENVKERTVELADKHEQLKEEITAKEAAQKRIRELEVNSMLTDVMGWIRHSIGQSMLSLVGYLNTINEVMDEEQVNKKKLYTSIGKLPSAIVTTQQQIKTGLEQLVDGKSNPTTVLSSLENTFKENLFETLKLALNSSKLQKEKYDPKFSYSINGAARVINRIHGLVASMEKFVKREDLKDSETINLKKYISDYIYDYSQNVTQNDVPYDLKKNNVKIIVDIPDSLTVGSKKGILDDIIFNQVQNCIDHAFESKEKDTIGTITIKAYTTEKDNQYTQIEISDDGRGIAPEVLKDIFNPNISTKKTGTGGLGAPSMRRWALWHKGGSINYETEINKRTTVKTVLPSKAYN